MDNFEKGLIHLLNAKVSALEGSIQKHHPHLFDDYWVLLKTSVAQLYDQHHFDDAPRLKEEVKKHFDFD